MRLKNLLVVAAVLLVGVGAWFANAYVEQKKRIEGGGGFDPAALKQRHPGAGPCLRWDFEARPTDAEIHAVADALRADGLTANTFTDLVPVFLGWSRERENEAHGATDAEEFADALSQTLSGRVYVWLNHRRIEQVFTFNDSRIDRAKPALDALPPQTQQKLRTLVAQYPLGTSLRGAIDVVRSMRGAEAEADLDAIAAAMRQVKAQTGAYPRGLDALSGVDRAVLTDPWGTPIRLEEDEHGLRLVSWGADQQPGGTFDDDADHVRVLGDGAAPPVTAVPGEQVQQAVQAPPPPAACGTLPAKTVLSRAEFDAAIADATTLSKDARIVPAFANGKAIGFKIFALQPGSLSARAGLCNRDVIKRVNGVALESPDAFLQATEKVKRQRRFELVVERQGAEGTLTVVAR